MPVVWALRGATDADVVVPAEFVSICNNKGPNNPVPVTDLDISRMSLGWGCNAFHSPHLLLSPLTDMSAAILPNWVIMDKC